MTLGINITISKDVSRRPTLICVNERDEGLKSAWKWCKDHPKAVSGSQPDTPVIFLCPLFFWLPLAPDVDDCPRVDHAETRLVGSSGIHNNQYKFLVQELAKFYIHGTIGEEERLPNEIRDIRNENSCLELPGFLALRNPSSYAYFAACECWHPFLHSYSLIFSFEREAADGGA